MNHRTTKSIRVGLAGALFCAGVLLSGCKTSTPATWNLVRFSPDGSRLAAARNAGGAIAVSEFALSGELSGRDVVLPFGDAPGRLIDLNYNGSGELLILCHITNDLSVWNTRQGTMVAHRVMHSWPLAGLLSRDGYRSVVCLKSTPANTNAALALINWRTGASMLALPEHQGLLGLALSGNGQRLATLDGLRVARIWDTDTGELVFTLPADSQKGAGISLDERGDTVALLGADTRVHHVDAPQGNPITTVPNAAPKAGTVLGGISMITVGMAVGGYASSPYWFKAAPTLALCVSDDGSRVGMMNPAPNLNGGFQIRVADARTGRAEVARGLSASFTPLGPPVFSPNGVQVAVPGNGVRLLDFPFSPRTKPNDLWLGNNKPGPPPVPVEDWHERRYVFEVEPMAAAKSVSALARAPHRRVCFEETVNASENQSWMIPLPLGMKKYFLPSKPANVALGESLQTVWQDCGQELVHLDQQFNLSSTVTKWELDCEHSFSKGWDLTAVIEIELTLKDAAGTVLHSARYSGTDHQTKLWEPTVSLVGKMHGHALNTCLSEMKNDPRWEHVLATATAMRK